MQHKVSREDTLASWGGAGAASQGRVTQDAGSRQDDSFSVEETRSPSQLARESCRGRAGPGAVGQGSPGLSWGPHGDGVVMRLRGPGWGQTRTSRWTCGCRENSKSGQPGWGAGRGHPCPAHSFPLPERPPRRPLHSPGVWLQLPLQPTLLFWGPQGGLGATLGLRGPQQGSGVAKTGRLVDGQRDAGSG